jgi:hypothetical protein
MTPQELQQTQDRQLLKALEVVTQETPPINPNALGDTRAFNRGEHHAQPVTGKQ